MKPSEHKPKPYFTVPVPRTPLLRDRLECSLAVPRVVRRRRARSTLQAAGIAAMIGALIAAVVAAINVLR